MWELDHKESWALKNWCFWTVVSEKTLESPLDCKEIKPVNSKGGQSWVFIGRTDADAPILWLPDVKNRLLEKDSDAGKDWRWKKGTTEDEMVGWHHRLYGPEFEEAPGLVMDTEAWQRIGHDWATELNLVLIKSPFATVPFFWAFSGTQMLCFDVIWRCPNSKKVSQNLYIFPVPLDFSAHEMIYIFISSSVSFQAEYKIKSFLLGRFIFICFVCAIPQGTCKMLKITKQSFASWSVYWAKASVI